MKKSHTPKKGSKRKPAKRKGLGTTKKGTSNRAKGLVSDLVDSGKTLAGHTVGFLGGAMIAKAIDKVPFLAENTADNKIVGYAKKLAKPFVLLGLGTATRVFATKDADKSKHNQFVKAIGEGLNVSGAFSGAQIFIKSDVFAGLGSADDNVGNTQQAEYFRENMDALEEIARENKAQLNLAAIDETAELNGDLAIPGTQLNLSDSKMIL